MTKNLIHLLPSGENPPHEIYALIEIPKGCSNKYEYDKKLNVFRLDRVLYEAVFYPTEYGIIPKTLTEDNDPLDIMVLSTFPTFPGCLISCRPIGVIKMIDSGDEDNKIIAVAADDPRFETIDEISDLSPHFKKEIRNFWENYAELQPDKSIKVKGWGSRETAKKMIKEAIEKYHQKKPNN